MIFLTLLSLLVFENSYAAIEDSLTEKYNLEKSITERIEQSLKPRIEKGYFDVSVDVRLAPARHASTGKDYNAIQSVKITLGISDKVNPSYRMALEDWIKKWSESSFGAKGEAEIVVRGSEDASLSEKNQPKENWLSILVKMQNLLGMIFLGVILAAMRFVSFKTKSTAGNLPVEASQLPVVVDTMSEVKKIAVSSEVSINRADDEGHLQTLRLKIAMLVPNALERTEGLINKWSQSVNPQYIKIAALMDALTESWRFSAEKSKTASPSLPPACLSVLPDALFNLQNLKYEEKLFLYKEIYADLISENVLDIHAEELSFLNELTDSQVTSLMEVLTETEKVTVFMQMSSEMKYRYLAGLPQGQVDTLLEQSLSMEPISYKDIRKKIQDWQSAVLLGGQDAHKNHMRLAKLRESVSQLSIEDEATWLFRAYQKHRDSIHKIHPDLNQIGLIPFWPHEKIQKLCMSTKSRDLAAAIEKIPFLKEPFLRACGDTTRNEILKASLNFTEDSLAKSMESFITTFNEFSSKGSPESVKRVS